MELDKRFRIDKIHAKSLEGNPINSPVERDIRIYLPPGYYESEDQKYPVIYFLHGYGQNNHSWIVVKDGEIDAALPMEIMPKKYFKMFDINKVASYDKIDEAINNGDIKPFIFVQPDASLHLPTITGGKGLTGNPATKGSFFYNSPYTGNFMDFIINDVIDYIDNNYRTIPDREHRALMGASMGGYGTVLLSLHHPEKFISAAALSPGSLNRSMLDWNLITPMYVELLGQEKAEEYGKAMWDDILDSYDLIFSKENPILPSVKRDQTGKIVDYNKEALKNWEDNDLKNLIRKNPDSLKQVNFFICCEKTDEFNLTPVTEDIHQTLNELGIKHECDIYSDPKAYLSPHMVGISYTVIPGIKFCSKFFS